MQFFYRWACPALFSSLFLLSLNAAGDVRMQREGEGRFWTVNIDGIDFTPVDLEGKSFVKASLRGVHGYEGIAYDEGKPELPVVRLWIDGDGDLKVEAASDSSTLRVPGPTGYLRPSVASPAKRPGMLPHLALNWAQYLASVTTDKPPYEITDAGTVRGVRLRLVTLYPFRYNPSGKSGSLTLSFKISQAQAPAAEATTAHNERFALVVPEKFASSPALKRFKQFKESLGYTVDMISVSASEATPEKIRAALKDSYEYNDHTLRYAILVGTNADLPGYQSSAIGGVTDHYYRCLDTDDYEKDVAAPDIGVGRFSARNEEDIAAIVDKTIAYEKGQFTNDDWLRKLSFIASDDGNFWQVAEGSHDYVIDRYTSTRGYLGSYPDADEKGGDKIYAVTYRASTPEILHQVTAGRGIINYDGHGGSDQWVSPHFTVDDVKALKPNGALPWVIANACDTADFRNADSIAEAWERAPGGAVAYLGSMDSTYWDEDDIFERRMYDGVYESGVTRLGDIAERAKSEVWRFYGGKGRSRYYSETYVMMGDPSLMLRTWSTRAAKIWGPTQIHTGTANVRYQIVDENNVPQAGARVALTSNSYEYRTVALTDTNGMVTLPIGKGTRYTVTASGLNLRLASQTLHVRESDNRPRRSR